MYDDVGLDGLDANTTSNTTSNTTIMLTGKGFIIYRKWNKIEIGRG